MLVLARCENETLRIGRNLEIEITVVEVRKNGQVKLGIVAHPDYHVARGELVNRWDRCPILQPGMIPTR